MENNQTKIREALEFVHDKLLTWNYTDKATAKMAVAVVDRCSKALSAPPRQCEVGAAEEQVRRFSAFCDLSKSCRSCPVYKPKFTAVECFAQWAQSPYSENNGVK